MAVVVDNSVVVAWFVDSQSTAYTRRLRRVLQREQLIVPALWPMEFANALRGLERRKLLLPHQVDRVLAGMEALGFVVDAAPAAADLVALSRRLGLSCYDAAYLESCLRRRVPLGTRDKLMRDAARAAGVAIA